MVSGRSAIQGSSWKRFRITLTYGVNTEHIEWAAMVKLRNKIYAESHGWSQRWHTDNIRVLEISIPWAPHSLSGLQYPVFCEKLHALNLFYEIVLTLCNNFQLITIIGHPCLRKILCQIYSCQCKCKLFYYPQFSTIIWNGTDVFITHYPPSCSKFS